MFGKIIRKVLYLWNRRNGAAYINFLKEKGISIGERCEVKDPLSLDIDFSRPCLLSIGNHVFLHRGLTIMTHDWASWVFLDKYNDFIPSHGKVTIGNNVWFGENVTVLKGVTIGDNCIIGAGSIVTRSIPDNSVAVGIPCRVISSIDEYYKKRKVQYPKELYEYAIYSKSEEIENYYDDYPLFIDKDNIAKYPNIPYLNVFREKTVFEKWLSHHKKVYDGFDEFISNIKSTRNEA